MDWLSVTSALILPVGGWLLGRLSRLENSDAKLASAIENLNETTTEIWNEIKKFREFDKRIYILEQRQKNK